MKFIEKGKTVIPGAIRDIGLVFILTLASGRGDIVRSGISPFRVIPLLPWDSRLLVFGNRFHQRGGRQNAIAHIGRSAFVIRLRVVPVIRLAVVERLVSTLNLKIRGGGVCFNNHSSSGNIAVGGEPREGADGPGGGHERGGCAEAQYG